MDLRPFATAFSALLLLAAGASGQTTSKAALLVLSKQDHTLAIVDPSTLQVEAKIPVGDDPHEVVASSDGKTAYVSNYGFGAFHTITVVDLVGRKPAYRIDLGALRGPHGLAFNQGKVWFTAEAAKSIGRYDPQSGKIDLILGIGQNRTHMLYIFPDGRRAVTTNVNSGTVSILDKEDAPPRGGPVPPPETPPGFPQGAILPPGGDWNETVIPVGARDEGFDVTPDGKEAWIGNAGDGTISVIDIAAKRVAATIGAHVKSVNRVKITPDGRLALISLLGGTELVIVDTATRQVVKRLPIGHGAAGIQMQPDGARAYVSCSPDNYVVVIDLKKLAVAGQIDAGGNPDGLAWAVLP